MSLVNDLQLEPFLNWFQSNQGSVDVSALDIVNFPASEGGRGAIALKDIPVGQASAQIYLVCFTIM